ncbi:integrase [Pseudomonas sp. AFG_SD02_1510_Pfu_092]|uniref:tyrosine-type recombinase/integrase n=1 Tax=Pseudomonas sp. AFG_SD02_1510_Pfu_092 TaxID=2259497 RepID=UPI000DEFA310|nr:site-specific integrase [Pseudomonas sp. AFG_SD02_1510_Pfu_092]RCL22990.1 integrase [Pseudomonas sp. AFG_SD02_1510_Pfu_092]
MPKRTLNLALSEAAIKKHAADLNVYQLNDPRHPVRFRYRHDRNTGSWFVLRFAGGRVHWRKAANWPDVSAKAFLEHLPSVHARLLADPAASVTIGCCNSVDQVLTWYYNRMLTDTTLSKSRKSSVLSVVRVHLRPRLEGLQLYELTPSVLDSRLVWPMLEKHKPAYVRGVFGVLKQIFSRAQGLQQITTNPLERASFSKSTGVQIKPKGARLRHVDVVGLLEAWCGLFESSPMDVAFAVMMLAHGARISETRLARWKNVNLGAAEWFVPAADTKSKRDHVRPLTPQVVAFLTRYRNAQLAKGYDGGHLFPSLSRPGRPLSRTQAFAVFERLGAGEWTSHDLRKLARECWAKLKVDSLVVKLLLNHKLTDLEATYFQSRGEEIKRDALELWHGWLDSQGFDLLQGETVVRQPARRASVDPAGWLR